MAAVKRYDPDRVDVGMTGVSDMHESADGDYVEWVDYAEVRKAWKSMARRLRRHEDGTPPGLWQSDSCTCVGDSQARELFTPEDHAAIDRAIGYVAGPGKHRVYPSNWFDDGARCTAADAERAARS